MAHLLPPTISSFSFVRFYEALPIQKNHLYPDKMTNFVLPPIHDNADGSWGPSTSTLPAQFKECVRLVRES